jgi:hypothetical protein
VGITYEDLLAKAGGTVGRPHFAQLLLERGIVTSIEEAFRVWLGNHGKVYVPKVKLGPAEAIELLRGEGATTVLAHPYMLRAGGQRLIELLLELKAMGLEGLEAYYTEHSPTQTREYLEIAEKHGFVVAGGSDFHGGIKPDIGLGTGRGKLHVPREVYDQLCAYRTRQGLWT